MKLQKGEQIIKVYHHHKFFFFWRGVKVWAASLPFFMLVFVISILTPAWLDWTMTFSILALFALVTAYDFLMYYLDTLVITNQRVVHLDWINLFKYTENQANLNDIQDIGSSENGFLSKFKILDFGILKIETSSTKTILVFNQAPDPEEIKFFVTTLSRQHSGLETAKPVFKKMPEVPVINQKSEIPSGKVATLE